MRLGGTRGLSFVTGWATWSRCLLKISNIGVWTASLDHHPHHKPSLLLHGKDSLDGTPPPLLELHRCTGTGMSSSTTTTSQGGAGGRSATQPRKRRSSGVATNREADDGDAGAPASSTASAKRMTRSGTRSTNTSKADAAANGGDGSPLKAKEVPHDDPFLLFSLNDGRNDGDNDDDGSTHDLVVATLVSRPSRRNKSPYVADVYVPFLKREAICHVPNLDMGGKCRPGVQLLVKRARDNKGRLVGPDATSPKYGTPKCEFILQLLYVDESAFGDDKKRTSSNDAATMYPPVWVGAHPSLGERIAKAWIERNLLPQMHDASPVSHVQSQVSVPEAPGRRFDFMITYEDGTKRIVEVKTVVDCDYSADAPPPEDLIKCRYLSNSDKYERTAIFPWGTRKQKGGTNGTTPVVSSRAIHHVSELSRLVQGRTYQATLLFVVVRDDATSFRPNHEACPEFVKALRHAHTAGVAIVAKRARFGTRSTDHEQGSDAPAIHNPENCYSDIDLPIRWPDDGDDNEDCAERDA